MVSYNGFRKSHRFSYRAVCFAWREFVSSIRNMTQFWTLVLILVIGYFLNRSHINTMYRAEFKLTSIEPISWYVTPRRNSTYKNEHSRVSQVLWSQIVRFTVVCLVTWPLSESEVGVDLVLIKTPCFSYVNHVALMLSRLYLHVKSKRVCIKTRSTPASLPLKG